jgi:hypothetical protein
MPATLLDDTGHRGETEYEFYLLAEYLQISEAAIPAAEEAARAQLHEAVSSLKDEDQIILAASEFMNQAQRYRREFPLRLLYGFLIQLYTLMEDRARSLCRVIADRDGLECPQLPDPNRIGFVCVFRDWITKNTEGSSERWEFADSLRIIRNCVAHANGRINGDRNPQRLRETIQPINGVDEDEFGYIAIRATYCSTAYEQIKRLFDDIYQTTRFGTPFFLARRQSREIAVVIDQTVGSPIFTVLAEDEEPRTP